MLSDIQAPSSTPLSKRSGWRGVAIAVGVIVVILLGWGVLRVLGVLPSSTFPPVSSADWQAVFLTNNQVYFGHLKDYDRGYALLTGIFYLRVGEPLQQGSPPQGPILNLVKLGGELHGPQDAMYIPKDKIMFWENLKKDSQVVQAINNFLAKQSNP